MFARPFGRLLLLLPIGLFLASCKGGSEAQKTGAAFWELVDSARLDSAWTLLVDEDKVAMGREIFVAAFVDSFSAPAFHEDLGILEVKASAAGDTVELLQARRIPDYAPLRDMVREGRTMNEILTSLAGQGVSPRMLEDSTRRLTAIRTPQGWRVRLGLQGEARLRAIADSISVAVMQQINVQPTSAVARHNFVQWFDLETSIRNQGLHDVTDIRLEVHRGKDLVAVAVVDRVLAGNATWRGQIHPRYEKDWGPERFGTRFGSGEQIPLRTLRFTVTSARPADPDRVMRIASQEAGVEPVQIH